MFKIAIFIVPILAILKNTIERIFYSKKSVSKHIESINKYGVKGSIIRKPAILLVLGSFISSYWFIQIGIAWAIFGFIGLSSLCVVLLLPSHSVVMPELGSVEYENLLKKRTQQAIVGSLIVLAWVLSWAVT